MYPEKMGLDKKTRESTEQTVTDTKFKFNFKGYTTRIN